MTLFRGKEYPFKKSFEKFDVSTDGGHVFQGRREVKPPGQGWGGQGPEGHRRERRLDGQAPRHPGKAEEVGGTGSSHLAGTLISRPSAKAGTKFIIRSEKLSVTEIFFEILQTLGSKLLSNCLFSHKKDWNCLKSYVDGAIIELIWF